MRLIGLYGEQRSGKTTIANALEEEFGWHRMSFAQAIRDCVNTIWPYPPQDSFKNDVFEYGYSYRSILQKFGAFGRNEIHEDIWIDALFHAIPENKDIVIDDLRYANEAEAILNEEGSLIRIRMKQDDSFDLTDTHESERDWRQFVPDYMFQNNKDRPERPKIIANFIDEIIT